ncbi:polysaccharide deacetylase family protein [Paenibacillus ginsengarvi]|uniref:Xylanase deacetylase n=1 Tax=Paenibacillus ginsengarvi TaxID=400777 RepID=A0A3B0CM19_9BACL|nr:polysaccharide deacetylase family protein [Paenibacillus ginsengarvi]RKN85417.1 xylanase deacetylase [Paenibacillus ginsengarvi]
MRKLSSLLAVALTAGTLLSACSDTGKESSGLPQGGKETLPAQQPENKPAPEPVKPTPEPVKESKPAEEPKKEPDPAPVTTPAQQSVQSQTYQPPKEAAKPTAADKKAVSWYYMKKKKGEVPGFPAEVKQLKPGQKAVWVGTGKKVYLTIDVGGELLDYKKLLGALRDNDVKATFFVTGYNLKNNPDYLKLLLEEGHTVGNHTITHKDFTTLTDDQVKQEVTDFEKLYKGITGQDSPKYFRFPYGTYSPHLLTLLTDLGYTSYFWSTAMKDWEPRKNGADDAYNDIIGNLHDGNVILMHQASKENIEAMDRILKQIKSEGYEFGTLAELQK